MAHPLALPGFLRWTLTGGLLALAACVPEVELPDDAEACAGLRCSGGQCVSNAGQPMCRCGLWEANAKLDCELGGAAEPDDHGASPGDATVLTLPMPERQGLIGSMGSRGGVQDVDLFAFTAGDRHVYRFICDGYTLPACQVRLLDASGHLTPDNRESRSGVWTVFATLAAGPWYLEVSNGSRSGTYRYQLVDLGRDDHGDLPATATVLQTPSTALPVTHTTQYDEDVFTFRAEAGHRYRFFCEAEGTERWDARSWQLRLTTEEGTQVASYAGSAPESTRQAEVSHKPSLAANLFVHVRVQSGIYPLHSGCRLEDQGDVP